MSRLCLAVCGMCIVASVYSHFKVQGNYEAGASLWIDPFVPDPSHTNALISVIEPRSLGAYRNTMVKVLGARSSAQLTAQHLMGASPAMLPASLAGRDENELTEAIMSVCRVRASADDAVLSIVASHTDAEVPALLANALADTFIAFNLQFRLRPHSNAVDSLAREVERLAFAQVDAVSALEEYQAKMRDNRVEERSEELLRILNDLQAARVSAMRESKEAEADWMDIADVDPGDLYQVARIAKEPAVVVAREALVKQAGEVRTLEQRYGDKHPMLKEARANLDGLRAELVQVCGEARDAIFAKAKSAQARVSEIQNEIASVEKALRPLRTMLLEYTSRESDANAVLTQLDRMRDELFDARLAVQYVMNDLRFVERAHTPSTPIRHPASRRFLLLAAISVVLAIVFRGMGRSCARESGPGVLPEPAIEAKKDPGPPAAQDPFNPEDQPADLAVEKPDIEAPLGDADTGNSGGDGPDIVDPAVSVWADDPQASVEAELVVDTAPPAEPRAEPPAPPVDLPVAAPAGEVTADASVEEPTSDGQAAEAVLVMSPLFWTSVRYEALDALEKAAVDAGQGAEPWERLLAHVVAAQDRERLTRLARHLRQTRPFGDHVRRLIEAHLARLREDYTAALRIYKSGLATAPGHPDLLGGLARCALYLGDEAALTSALKTLDETGGESADASYVRGTVAAGEGRMARALEHLQICVRSVPDIDAMVGMAGLLAQNNLLGDAERSLRFALNVSPQHPGVLDVLGVVLYRANKTTEAVRVFDKALEIAPNAWGTMLHLVELYRDTGETLKAAALIRMLRAQREQLDEDLREVLDDLTAGSGTFENGFGPRKTR